MIHPATHVKLTALNGKAHVVFLRHVADIEETDEGGSRITFMARFNEQRLHRVLVKESPVKIMKRMWKE